MGFCRQEYWSGWSGSPTLQANSLPSGLSNIPFMGGPPFPYKFIPPWNLALLAHFSSCERRRYEHRCANLSIRPCFLFYWRLSTLSALGWSRYGSKGERGVRISSQGSSQHAGPAAPHCPQATPLDASGQTTSKTERCKPRRNDRNVLRWKNMVKTYKTKCMKRK